MKEQTVIVKGQLQVTNYKEVSKEDLLKINEIVDKYGNQIFQVDPENGVISPVEDTRSGKDVYRHSFMEPLYRLMVVADPEYRERVRYSSHYNNRIPTPEVSKKLLIDGEFRVTVPGSKTIVDMPFTMKDSRDIKTEEWKERTKMTKTEVVVLAIFGIITAPITIPAAIIMMPIIKIQDYCSERAYKKRRQKMILN